MFLVYCGDSSGGTGGAPFLPSSEWFLRVNHSVTEKHMPSNIDLHFRI